MNETKLSSRSISNFLRKRMRAFLSASSDVARLMLLFSCLVYCLIVTYQELYLRPSILTSSEPVQLAVKSPVRMACPVAT